MTQNHLGNVLQLIYRVSGPQGFSRAGPRNLHFTGTMVTWVARGRHFDNHGVDAARETQHPVPSLQAFTLQTGGAVALENNPARVDPEKPF